MANTSLDSLISGTKYSLKCVVDLLKEKNETFNDLCMENSLDRVEVHTLNGGMLSHISKLEFYFRGQPQDKPGFSVVFKVPTIEKLEAADGELPEKSAFITKSFLLHSHNNETKFYGKVPQFVQETNILPKMFAIRASPDIDHIETGFLILENLDSVKMASLADGLSKQQVESAIVSLATFHALSMTFPEDLMEEFSFSEYGTYDEDDLHLADRLYELPTDYFRSNKGAVDAFVRKHNRFEVGVHKKLGIRPVLSHGDFWVNNIFYDNETGENVHAIIDWQLAHPNTGLNDVLHLIYTSVNAEMRKKNFDSWITLYFETLQTEARKRKVDPPLEYSKNLIAEMIKEQAPFEIMFTCYVLLPTLAKEMEGQPKENLLERILTLFQEYQENIGVKYN